MKLKVGLLTAAFALLCLLGWTVSAQKQSPPKVTWEYMSTGTSDQRFKGDITLNELGAQGWELVSVTSGCSEGNCWAGYYFKRGK